MRAAILDGIVLGLQFGLLGVGLTLVYGLGGVLNLAHGQMAVLGAIVVALHHRRRRSRRASPCSPGSPPPARSAPLLDLTLMQPVYRRARRAARAARACC